MHPPQPYMSLLPRDVLPTPAPVVMTTDFSQTSSSSCGRALPLRRMANPRPQASAIREVPHEPQAFAVRSVPHAPALQTCPAGGGQIRYRKSRLLGRGAYGVVWMGLNIDNGQLVAIKEPHMSTRSWTSMLARCIPPPLSLPPTP